MISFAALVSVVMGRTATAAPANLILPMLNSRFFEVGDVVTASNGAWTQYPSSYTKTIYVNNISKGSSYTLQAADVGLPLKVGVVATNAIGSSAEVFTADYIIPTRANAFSGLAAWWDFSRRSTISTTGAAIEVTQVNDRSGNNRHLTPAAAANRPKSEDLISFIRGWNTGWFQTDDWLNSGLTSLGTTSLFADAVDRFTVAAVFKFDAATTGGTVIAKAGTTAGNRTFSLFDDNGTLKVTCRGVTTNLTSYTQGQPCRAAVRWNGTTLRVDVNGVMQTATVGTAAVESSQTIQVGSRSNGQWVIANGDIGEVAVYSTDLSDANMTALNNALNARWFTRTPKARVLICGASNELRSFFEQSGVTKTTGRFAKYYDEYFIFDQSSQSGAVAATVKTNLDAKLATYVAESYPTYVVIGSAAGNDVSNSRPYATASTTAKNDITTAYNGMISAINAKGFIPVVSDITYRHYAYTVAPNNDTDGSLHYNVNLIRPLVNAAHKYANGEPCLQTYSRSAADPYGALDADGIHLSRFTGQDAYQDELAYKLGGYIVNGAWPAQVSYTLGPL